MYKITIDHLEKLKKALQHSNKTIETANAAYKKREAISKNKAAIELINKYLKPQS